MKDGSMFAALSGVILLFLTFYPFLLMHIDSVEGHKCTRCNKRAHGLHCIHCGKRWKELRENDKEPT
jgi:hypothetical protein